MKPAHTDDRDVDDLDWSEPSDGDVHVQESDDSLPDEDELDRLWADERGPGDRDFWHD